MKIIITGEMSPMTLVDKIKQVAVETAQKLEAEQDVKLNGFKIHEAEVTVKYDIEGVDEPQVLTIEHHAGHPELFTWLLDAETGEKSSNEGESQYDEYTVAKSKGEDVQFKEIESIFNPEDLLLDNVEEFGDMAKETYNHVDGSKVMQIRQGGKLIQEMTLIEKKEEVIH